MNKSNFLCNLSSAHTQLFLTSGGDFIKRVSNDSGNPHPHHQNEWLLHAAAAAAVAIYSTMHPIHCRLSSQESKAVGQIKLNCHVCTTVGDETAAVADTHSTITSIPPRQRGSVSLNCAAVWCLPNIETVWVFTMEGSKFRWIPSKMIHVASKCSLLECWS